MQKMENGALFNCRAQDDGCDDKQIKELGIENHAPTSERNYEKRVLCLKAKLLFAIFFATYQRLMTTGALLTGQTKTPGLGGGHRSRNLAARLPRSN